MRSLILSTAARLLLPLILLFSLFLLLRGHHEPGGGFAGGLVTAAAFSLLLIAFNVRTARRALRINPRTLVGVGLVIALVSGSFGPLTGRPFLTGVWADLQLPGGAADLGSPLLFDIGVYLVVIGTTLTIILSLAEEE